MPHRLGRLELPHAIAASAVLWAGLIGLAMAYDLPKGIGLLLALAYVPLLLFDLAIALAIYVALIFIAQLPFTGPSETIAGALVLAAWAGALRQRLSLFRTHPALSATLAGFAIWLPMSITWAADHHAASTLLVHYAIALTAFIVVASFLRTERDYWIVAAGYLIGAVLLTIAGFAENGFTTAQSATQIATQVDAGRLTAGGGDPNYLAAGLLPAFVVGAGLFTRVRDPLLRLALAIGLVLLPVGIVASQSRGAMIASAVVLISALAIAKHHRAQVLAMIIATCAVSGLWLAANPAAAERIVDFNDGGAGRTDLWRVGWQMAGDHMVIGVGLNNFEHEAPSYSRKAGSLRFVELVAEQPHVAHNMYLQFLAETGIVGLGLFLGVLLGCLRATLEAARRFARSGRRAMETQARLLLVAQIGFLVASFFLSNASDVRLWILLGMGPGLLAIARPQGEALRA